MTAWLDSSTELANANHKLNSKADTLSRLLGALGSPNEQAESFNFVIEAIGELLVAKAERDHWEKQARLDVRL